MRTLIALTVLNHIAFVGSRIAVPLAALQLGASPFAIGLLLSFYGLLPMFLSVAGGRWVDRVGMRLPMIYGTVVLLFGVAVPCLMWDIGALYLSTVTIGLGFMAFHLSLQKAAGILGGPNARKDNFALMALGFSLSGLIGPTLTGIVIDATSYRVAFGVLALLPIGVLIALRRFPFASKLPHVRRDTSVPDGEPVRVLDLLRTPEMQRLYLAVTLLSSAWDVHQFLVPLYGAKIGLSASKIGMVLSAFSLATFLVRLALPWLARHVSEWPLILAAVSTAGVVYVLYPFFGSLPVMITLSFLLGLGLGMSQPMIMVLLHHASPPDRIGEAAGLRLTLVNGTQTFLPMTFGAFGGAFGLGAMFWGLSALLGGGLWYTVRGLRAEGRLSRATLRPASNTPPPPPDDEPRG
ncbi:MAG: MFS transporter [Burkholderiaceae bacterium]